MLEYLLLIPIFFSSMVYGIIGFGDALILIPIITPIIDLLIIDNGIKVAVILVNIWGLFPALINFIKYRKYLDKAYFFRFLSLGVPATILGTFLIINIRTEWIELVFGIFVLIYSTFKIIVYTKKSTQSESKQVIVSSSPIIFFGGFTYGLLTGLISAAGPLNVVLLEKTGHVKENFIGNFGAIGTVLSISRIPFYLFGGVFPIELIYVVLLAFPIILIGTKIGHKITPKISIKLFQLIIFCFLFIISVKSIVTSLIGLIIS
ncbi:MAG: sulfite exporter TauE/SafE family protein [Candidatus Hodarchaeota archaeon]